MRAGLPIDPKPGVIGKQRIVHNTYFTLPVVIIMLSNHHGFLTQHDLRYLLLLLMAAGAAIRVYFVQRHAHRHGRSKNPWPIGLIGILLILGEIAVSMPRAQLTAQGTANLPAPLLAIAEKYCLSCHGAAIQVKGLRLDSPQQWLQNASNIHQQVVIVKAMPMGNTTGMTDQERLVIQAWFESLGQSK